MRAFTPALQPKPTTGLIGTYAALPLSTYKIAHTGYLVNTPNIVACATSLGGWRVAFPLRASPVPPMYVL